MFSSLQKLRFESILLRSEKRKRLRISQTNGKRRGKIFLGETHPGKNRILRPGKAV